MPEPSPVSISFELDRYEGSTAVLYLTSDPRIKVNLPAELFEGSRCMSFKLVEDPATTERETERIEELQRELKQ